jgi:preprotein translocase subunit SecG
MDFTIFPFVMIALCVVMMVLMMHGMGCMHGGHQTRERDR